MGILDLVKSKLSCFNLWEHEKYIYINQIYKLYNGNNTCADQQPYPIALFSSRSHNDPPDFAAYQIVIYSLDRMFSTSYAY